jgi:hypothetical protein
MKMISMVEYLKNSMGKVNDTLNNKKMSQEPQHCIINIYNIDNDDSICIECDALMVIASIYFSIVIGLGQFPNFNWVHETQEYELRLDSQQIESILLKYDEMINLNPKNMEDSLFKDALQPRLNLLKKIFVDEE